MKKLFSGQASFFLLTAFCSIIILSSYHNFQYNIAQGDHGQNLYSIKLLSEGQRPYKDFFWFYGPAMLYYYKYFFINFGGSIQSILLGQNIIIFLISLMIFFICSALGSSAIAFIAAMSYLAKCPFFLHTYNHPGGILCALIILYCVIKYIKKPHMSYIFSGSFFVFLLSLIRINLGILTTFWFFLSIGIIDFQNPDLKRKRTILHVSLFVLTFGLTALVYWALLREVPFHLIEQCFPYFTNKPPDHSSMIFKYFQKTPGTFPIRMITSTTLLLLSAVLIFKIFISLINKNFSKNQIKTIILQGSALSTFWIINMHEFILSGTSYRMRWAEPAIIVFSAFLLNIFLQIKRNGRVLSFLKASFLFVFTVNLFLSLFARAAIIHKFKDPIHELKVGKTDVYSFQDPSWLKTVQETSFYIQDHTNSGEKIFAFPYDPIYYFLTDRNSATYLNYLFAYNNVNEKMQKRIISDLEKEKVNLIVMSNRIFSEESGLGYFGKTHCLLLWDYINKNFISVAKFGGSWDKPGGWNFNHSTSILERINPL